jgi:hypothetical protein
VHLEQIILQAIHQAAEKEIQAEADKAAERVRQIMREKTAAIMLDITKYIQFERMQDHIVVTIRDKTQKDGG